MNTPMVYRWKGGAQVGAADPQAVGERLETIRTRNNGRMAPGDVVNDATDQASPLHPLFEWNDVRAAHAYRLEQAGYIIRHIAVEIAKDEGDGEPTVTRAFVSIREDDSKQRYTSVQAAMADPDLREQVMRTAWAELQSWQRKYQELKVFAGVFSAMEKVERKIAKA
jgi:hypothetical protein